MGTRFRKVVTAAVFVGQLLASPFVKKSFAQEADPFKNLAGKQPTMPVVVPASPASTQKFPVYKVSSAAEELIQLQQQFTDFIRGRTNTSGGADISSKFKSLSPFQKGQLTLYLVSELYAIDPELRNSNPRGQAIYGII